MLTPISTQSDVLKEIRDLLDEELATIDRSQKRHSVKTIASLSDEQFELLTFRIKHHMSPRQIYWNYSAFILWNHSDLKTGIPILAGRHPYLKARTYARSAKYLKKSRKREQKAADHKDRSTAFSMLQNRVRGLPLELFYAPGITHASLHY